MNIASRSNPKVSVVIPTKNAGLVFRKVLQALKAQEYEGDIELIAIDSGSTDGTLEVASEFGATVIVVPPAEFDHGLTRNRGIEAASGDIIVMMSQDAVPGNPYLARNFVSAFDDPKIAGAYARQVAAEEADVLTKRNAAAALAGRTAREVHWIEDWAAYRKLSPVERYYFCNFDDVCSAIRKSVWRSIPFRASDFGEDLDWSQQILEAGWKIAYWPEAYVVHSHQPSFRYLYERHRLTLRKLHQQFGVSTVPSLKSLMKRTLYSSVGDWAYVIRHESRIPALGKAMLQVPFYSFASLYGQYRGVKDARKLRGS